MSVRLWLGALSLALLLAPACGQEGGPKGPAPEFPFRIKVAVVEPVHTPNGDLKENGLAKIPVLLDGNTVGYTDANGKFEGAVLAQPGTSITLGVAPVEGLRYEGQSSIEDKFRVARGTNKSITATPISLKVVAISAQDDYKVWFRTTCEPPLKAAD